MATRAPPRLTRGIDQPSRRSNGATAREVTTANSRSPCNSSARARITSTLPNPRAVTASSRNMVRRASGSTRVTCRSGRLRARTRPGNPAPLPMSATSRPSGIARPNMAQFSRCRSQSRGTSRGPIRPRTTPCSASRWANCSASAKECGNTPSATVGAAGVSRETGSITSGSSGRHDDDVPHGLGPLGL